MKLFTLLFIGLAIAFASIAGEVNHCRDAIAVHIKDAILHNQQVAPVYHKLSVGKSAKLSRNLILAEKISLQMVKKIEREAKAYREKGVSLLCEELAEMKDVPVFQERLSLEQRPVEFYAYDHRKISKLIKILMDGDQLDEAYDVIAGDLRRLQQYPNQLCLTKHFLESIARSLLLSYRHREDAKRLGLPDPIKLIKKFITLQRRSLLLTHYLDREAFPLQKEGLLIYCQDVPVISWE